MLLPESISKKEEDYFVLACMMLCEELPTIFARKFKGYYHLSDNHAMLFYRFSEAISCYFHFLELTFIHCFQSIIYSIIFTNLFPKFQIYLTRQNSNLGHYKRSLYGNTKSL